jgi:hypothetical protein
MTAARAERPRERTALRATQVTLRPQSESPPGLARRRSRVVIRVGMLPEPAGAKPSKKQDKPVASSTVDFKGTNTDPAKFIPTAFVPENTGVHAYLGQAGRAALG